MILKVNKSMTNVVSRKLIELGAKGEVRKDLAFDDPAGQLPRSVGIRDTSACLDLDKISMQYNMDITCYW